MVFDGVFDGFFMLAGLDASFINARHKNRTVTNLLMADGHAETAPTNRVAAAPRSELRIWFSASYQSKGLPDCEASAWVGSVASGSSVSSSLASFTSSRPRT